MPKIYLSPTDQQETAYANDATVNGRKLWKAQRTIEGRLETAELKITPEAIVATVTNSSEYTTLESVVSQTASDITLKVSKNDVINQINLSTEGIVISAAKINLSGYVTFTNLSTSGQTTINGGNITTGTMSADRIYGGTINGNTVSVINLNASNITAGSLSVDRLTVGTVSGWYFGSSDISRSGISLGAGNITLTGQGTGGPSINFNYGGGSTRLYNYAQGWIAAQNSFRVDSTLRVIGDTTIDSDLVAGTGTFGYTITTFVRPSSDNLYDVGTASFRYDDIYATNNVIQTSDRTQKTNIAEIDKGIDLILNLPPVQFNFIDRTRTHYGFIAQDVKKTMTDIGIVDAAVYIEPEEGFKGLRYTELIAPMVQTIQSLEKRIKELENAS